MVPSYAFSKALCQHYLLLLLIFHYSFDYNIKKNKTIWNYNFLFPHPQCLPPVLPLVKFLYGLDFHCGIHSTYLSFEKKK